MTQLPAPLALYSEGPAPAMDIDYANTITQYITNLTAVLPSGDPDVIFPYLMLLIDAIVPGVLLPDSFFIDSGLWSQLVTTLSLNLSNPPFFDELCFLMARIAFHTKTLGRDFPDVLFTTLLRFIVATPDSPHYYLINLLVNLIDDHGGSLLIIKLKFDVLIGILASRPLVECDLVLLSHVRIVMDFREPDVPNMAFLNLLFSQIPVLLSTDIPLLRIALFVICGACVPLLGQET
jgi:hypothetical protein